MSVENALTYLIDTVKNDNRFATSYQQLVDAYTLTTSHVPVENTYGLIAAAISDFDVDIVDQIISDHNEDVAALFDAMYPEDQS